MLPLDPAAPFAAIDFETADYQNYSACAVSLLRVEGLQIVSRRTRLIRPPRQHIVFTYIHGITWQHVKAAPTFGEIWPELNQLLDGVAFVAAHNAGFDRNVLQRCCQAAVPDLPAAALPVYRATGSPDLAAEVGKATGRVCPFGA